MHVSWKRLLATLPCVPVERCDRFVIVNDDNDNDDETQRCKYNEEQV